jgi:ATP-dependent helicase/nuclease subunit B
MGATVVSSSASHRRIAISRAWLEARAPAEEVLIVGATPDAANELARIVAQTKGAAFGYHRMTLARLAVTLARAALAARSAVPLGRVGVEAVANRVVHKLAEAGELGRYASLANGPGFARAIASVITELRLEQIAPDAVVDLASDLSPILRAYEAELAEHGFTDWPGVLYLAAAAASDHGYRHQLLGLPTLLLDVPVTTASDLSLVRALCSRTSEILVTAPASDSITLARLRTALETDIVDLDSRPAPSPALRVDERGSLTRVQHHLFNDHSPVQVTEPDDQVVIFSAPGESRECVEIARRALALARDGVAFDRMAVLLRSPEEYRSHLEEAFARAGAPAHFARGAVRPDPAGRAFHALLCCAAENLSARRFAEYLSLSQVPEARPDGTPPEAVPRSERWIAPDQDLIPRAIAEALSEQTPAPAPVAASSRADQVPVIAGQLRAPRRWERLLVEAAVIGGRERWRKRIDGLAGELRSHLAEIDGEDEAKAALFRRTLQDLEAFAGYALPLIESLDALPKSAKWGEWLNHLGALATRALRQPQRVLSVLSEFAPMAAVGPVTLNDVLLVVSDLLLQVGVPPPAQRYGRIFIGPVEAARGISFEAVFVPGLAEKLFPRKIVEEPILLDAVRARLNAGLPTNVERVARERLALSLAAAAAERRLYLSYPRLDLEQARPRVPSFYALEAVRAAEGRLPNFAELDRRAEAVTSTRVGWPAPSDPAEAIDHAEHDLAILDRLLALDPAEAGGAARYLLTANSYLSRALRTRWQRWSPRWTSADGLFKPSAASRAAIAKHALGARNYSPTALQAYAACPYRFFLQAIHRLAPREVPEAIDELDPLQRGSLIHDVQFELFERLRAVKLLPVRRQDLDRARNILDEVVEELASRYYSDLAPAIDRVWIDGIAAIRAELREWLRRTSEDDSGYAPWRFELSFGLGDVNRTRRADPHSVPGAVDLDCGIQLRGSMDLVERHPSGHLRVTDHKTGKSEGKDGQIVAGGMSLQPALYALAAEKIFGRESKVDCGRLFFCTSVGGFSERIVKLDAQTRDAVAEVAQIIGQALDQPFLPAAPAERQCRWCDYRSVCGPYEELRTRRKPKEMIAPLLTLRGIP